MSVRSRFGPGAEFRTIEQLVTRWGPLARGIGDDGAIVAVPLGEQLVVSTDASVEGVHFRRQWLSGREIGYRATAAALSDLAAMAALPLGVLVSLVVPTDWTNELDALADGIGDAVGGADTVVIGGDMSRGAQLTLAVTVLGHAHEPLRRSGARPGDSVYVTGRLGAPFAALAALASGADPGAARGRFAHPTARIPEARWLAERGASSAVDLSDGLAADAGHIAAASGVLLRLDLDRVPLAAPVGLSEAARSGEEYELLVTSAGALDTDAFASRFGVPLTSIGHVLRGPAGVETFAGGERVDLPRGYDHFSP